jgi:hypothetical protein
LKNGRRFLAGFGGGNDISENLLFETCGESGDHGAINSWDRQAFITSVATGQPSFIPAVTHIHHNFIVADGNADGGAVDNDDGSSHYSIHHNFAIYGGAKINNIGGHSQVSERTFLHLNLNWSPFFSRCCLKTAGNGSKRPET